MTPLIQIDPTLGVDLGDRALWADQVRKAKGDTWPRGVNLEEAITGLEIVDTMEGASTINLKITDPDWELVDSKMFDANENGLLDAIDVNFPENTRFWWRLTQVGIDATRGGAELSLTFMERPAVLLMRRLGPLKMKRGKTTRAEFMKVLADKVKEGGGIDFISKQLHTRQPIGRDRVPRKSREERARNKDAGIDKTEELTIKGAKATRWQLSHVERALDVAARLNASERATLALLVAGIGESNFRTTINELGFGGVFQGQVETRGRFFSKNDTEEQARYFLLGGKGFQGGGAIKLAREGMDPGTIATTVEASGKPGSFYGKHLDEAKALLRAYGGPGVGAPDTYRAAYHFKVGRRESYWKRMRELADEVNWALFLDGNRMYFDSEPTLMKQKVAAVVRRRDPELVSFQANWDERRIATEATLELICDPFRFRAGEVLKLEGFGPGSTCSSVKLPGRWLIAEMRRDRFGLVTTFSLKQAERQKPEPPAQLKTREAVEDLSGADGGPLRERIVAIAKASMTRNTGHNYYLAGGNQSELHVVNQQKRGYRSDCSQWIHAVYLKAGAPSPGLTTMHMATKSKRTARPKPGDLLLGPNHVELYIGSGQTIGHGSPPIDFSTVSYWKARGFWFATYDFLDGVDHGRRKPRPRRRGPLTGGGALGLPEPDQILVPAR